MGLVLRRRTFAVSTRAVDRVFSKFSLACTSRLLLSTKLNSTLVFNTDVFALERILSIGRFLRARVRIRRFEVGRVRSETGMGDSRLSEILRRGRSLVSLGRRLGSRVRTSRGRLGSLKNRLDSIGDRLRKIRRRGRRLMSRTRVLSEYIFSKGGFDRDASDFPTQIHRTDKFASENKRLVLILGSVRRFRGS